MKTTAKVLEDSVNLLNDTRLITMELCYPRCIHAEFMTHRVFSRNASSSRAVPITKMIEEVEKHYFRPIEWGQNKPGMQAGEVMDTTTRVEAENVWALAVMDAIKHAKRLKDLGLHKQHVNRILEPFAFIRVIVTATDWDNFFDLRIGPLAQPEIKDLAEKMRWAQSMSVPVERQPWDYHAPYLSQEERATLQKDTAMMVSAARCARVSYLNHDGMEPNVAKDLVLANRLLHDRHASVFEHQAMPKYNEGWSDETRNFRGWAQHRALLKL